MAAIGVFACSVSAFNFLFGGWTTLGTFVNHGWHIRLYVFVKRDDMLGPTTAPRGPGK